MDERSNFRMPLAGTAGSYTETAGVLSYRGTGIMQNSLTQSKVLIIVLSRDYADHIRHGGDGVHRH